MDFYDGLNYLYYIFFIILLLFLVTELLYKIVSNNAKSKIGRSILIVRKIYFLSILLVLYITASLLYYNDYGFIKNNLYYSSITRDIFIGIALSMAYVPILYLYVRTFEFHSNASNIFTRNKFRYVIDLLVFGFTIAIFVLNSSTFY